MTLLLRINGQTILLMNAEKAAGPMENPKSLLKSYC